MVSRQKLKRSILASLVTCAVAVTCSASDLSDNMQLFFKGDYQSAHERLSKSIGTGPADARAYYFRGLASYRMGDVAAAIADFRAGAQLEARGLGSGAGQALQRIQGIERLQLEKYRRMAKLEARQRSQPTAPRPIARRDVRLTSGDANGLTAGLRLASEVPLAEGLQADPFVDDPSEEFAAPVVPPVKSIEVRDQPVGTGVAEASNVAEFRDAGEDPFGSFNDLEPSARVLPPATSPSPGGGTPLGVFGAILRALGKATIPDPRPFVPSGLAGGPPAGDDESVFGDFDDNAPENQSGFPPPPGFGDAEPTADPQHDDDPFGGI